MMQQNTSNDADFPRHEISTKQRLAMLVHFQDDISLCHQLLKKNKLSDKPVIDAFNWNLSITLEYIKLLRDLDRIESMCLEKGINECESKFAKLQNQVDQYHQRMTDNTQKSA